MKKMILGCFLVLTGLVQAEVDKTCGTQDRDIQSYQPRQHFYHNNEKGMFVRILYDTYTSIHPEDDVTYQEEKKALLNLVSERMSKDADESIKFYVSHIERNKSKFNANGFVEELYQNKTGIAEFLRSNLITSEDFERTLNIYFTKETYAGDFQSTEDRQICAFTRLGDVPIIVIYEKPECKDANGTYETVLSHQIGHFLGVKHTHATDKGEEYVDRNHPSDCKKTGDGFCDTPSDPNLDGYFYINYYFSSNGFYFTSQGGKPTKLVDAQCKYVLSNKYAAILNDVNEQHIGDDGHFITVPNGFYMSVAQANEAVDYLTDPDRVSHEPDTRNIMSLAPVTCLKHFSSDQKNYMYASYKSMLKESYSDPEDLTNEIKVVVLGNPILLNVGTPRIKVSNSHDDFAVMFYDASGRVMLNSVYKLDGFTETTIDLPQPHTKGVYFYQVFRVQGKRKGEISGKNFQKKKGAKTLSGKIIVQ